MKHLLFLLSIATGIASFAQEHQCGTDYIMRRAAEKNPAVLETRQNLEKFTKDFIASGAPKSSAIKIIPVVFHIIHNNGPENVSKAQVLDALRVINEDFRKLNADT